VCSEFQQRWSIHFHQPKDIDPSVMKRSEIQVKSATKYDGGRVMCFEIDLRMETSSTWNKTYL